MSPQQANIYTPIILNNSRGPLIKFQNILSPASNLYILLGNRTPRPHHMRRTCWWTGDDRHVPGSVSTGQRSNHSTVDTCRIRSGGVVRKSWGRAGDRLNPVNQTPFRTIRCRVRFWRDYVQFFF